MIFAASDVESLSKSLGRWEVAEYVCAALVTIACAGEYVSDFTNWFTGRIRERKERLAKASTLLLICALSLELICLVRTNSLSGRLIGSLNEVAGEADSKAKAALSNSATALTQSGAAEQSSGRALDESGKATASASSALVLAGGARREADSFEKDIVSAKKQASDAESHLAEALKRAADTTAELDRIKSPRSLSHDSELVSALAVFKGTDYMFLSVYADQESIQLLREIDGVLQRAEWKRVQPSSPFPPAINVFGRDVNVAVSSGLTTGLQISVDSMESLTSLQALPPDKLPQAVKAAVVLNLSISSNLSPSQGETKVNVEKGASGTVRIAVGKKP
jgi:hypothetical protein